MMNIAAGITLPRGRLLSCDGKALIMGIINATPDSFYAESRVRGAAAAVDTAAAMIRDGADILDIGGESTRPGAEYISTDEELSRVLPVVEAIRARWDTALSVDTRKAAVADACIQAGADIINDISALNDDEAMAALAARTGVPVILMHKKGIPATMQDRPHYTDCVSEVKSFLLAAADTAHAAGIRRERIIFDPGIGFGKSLHDNLDLLARLDEIAQAGYPILVGLSRKSFIAGVCTDAGQVVRDAALRLPGSVAAACAARLKGAVLFRVHDVAETAQALAVFDAALRLRKI